jgi:protein-tyrosine phosphatase
LGNLTAPAKRPPRKGPLKRIYHTARNLPYRVLRGRRHAQASQRVLKLESVRSILVVCYGNICRSPYLEAVLRRDLPEITTNSAGFGPPGRPAAPHTLTLSGQRGFNLTNFQSSPIGRANVARTDLVIVMDTDQARQLTRMFRISPSRIIVAGDLDPKAGETRGIRDPWGESLEVFTECYDRLDRCAATLTRLLRFRR